MTSVTKDGLVEFRFFRPDVASVAIVGDFHGWDPRELAMNSDGQGWWTALLRFDAGEYRFRYLADGQWFSDFASYGVEMRKTEFHSILMVPQSAGAKQEPQYKKAKQVA